MLNGFQLGILRNYANYKYERVGLEIDAQKYKKCL